MPAEVVRAELPVGFGGCQTDFAAFPTTDLREGFAMSKPMFFFTGVYDTVAQAEQDYYATKRLHDSGGRRGIRGVPEIGRLNGVPRHSMRQAKADRG
jgi:hypothetical protein